MKFVLDHSADSKQTVHGHETSYAAVKSLIRDFG
jgi:hypothetical protein